MPAGTSTDLGVAAESAVEAMRGASPDQVQIVFFLTDGRHQPSSTSKYSDDLSTVSWTNLRESAKALAGTRPMFIGVLRLAAGADTRVVRDVFPNVVVADALDESALRGWFQNLAKQTAVTKLTSLIRRELALPSARLETIDPVETHSDRLESVVLRATLPRRIVATTLRDSSELLLAGSVRLIPSHAIVAGSLTLQLGGSRHALWTPPGSIRRDVSARVSVPTRLTPAEEFGRIGLPSELPHDTIEVRLSLQEGGALPRWAYYTVVLALSATLVRLLVVARASLHRPYLDGRLIVTSRDGRPGATQILRGKKLQTLTVTGSEGRSLVELRAENERGRTVVMAVPLAEDLTIGNKPFRSATALKSKVTISGANDEVTYLIN